jgi:hypothetical protein
MKSIFQGNPGPEVPRNFINKIVGRSRHYIQDMKAEFIFSLDEVYVSDLGEIKTER